MLIEIPVKNKKTKKNTHLTLTGCNDNLYILYVYPLECENYLMCSFFFSPVHNMLELTTDRFVVSQFLCDKSYLSAHIPTGHVGENGLQHDLDGCGSFTQSSQDGEEAITHGDGIQPTMKVLMFG